MNKLKLYICCLLDSIQARASIQFGIAEQIQSNCTHTAITWSLGEEIKTEIRDARAVRRLIDNQDDMV